MRIAKFTIFAIFALIAFAFFHYNLPQRDIVRIVNTYEERQNLQGWTTMFWGASETTPVNGVETRDIQFIQTILPNGKPMVFRNEDTGWGWPPYFKFDTASLYTEAADAISDKDTPEWVIVRHYGWRNEFLSIFPNAVSISPATGPEQRLLPWGNGILILGIVIFILTIRRLCLGFYSRSIRPIFVGTSENLKDLQDRFKR